MRAIVIVGVMMVAAGAGIGAQDPLKAAKDLYASAAYEDALLTLSRLDGATALDVARQADEYRLFCLYALGRTREAESIAESIIRKEPFAQLDAADASPRLELLFTDVRKRLLPLLIRDRFQAARSALGQKNLTTALTQLTEARLMIVEAEKIGAKDDRLADLSVLVDGFLQLIRSEADQGTSPQPAPAAASPSRVYSVDDADVTPPVELEQGMPVLTAEVQKATKALRTSRVLDIVIDETGRVVDATIRQPLNSSFDILIVSAARDWTYRPAMKDGVPVQYLKTLVLVP